MVFGTISLSTSFVGAFLLLIVLGWIIATKSLGKQFNRLTSQHEEIDIKDKTPIPTGEHAAPQVSAKPT